ncbi:hypothetical protein MBLNU457_g0446t1 [Dothideomycetes sp. NU457]
MTEAAPAKKGFRARLGLGSSKSPSPRKKLMKKGARDAYDTYYDERRNTSTDADRQGSYNSDLSQHEEDLNYYQVTGSSAPHTFRENPYSAIQSSSNAYPPRVPPQHEYAHNFSRQRQYPGVYYDSDAASFTSATNTLVPSIAESQTTLYAPPNRRMNSSQTTLRGYPSQRPPPANRPASNLSRAHELHRSLIDKDTGERKDLTEMMHAFTYEEHPNASTEEFMPKAPEYDPSKPDGTATLASASPEIWQRISKSLSPADTANLSITCRTMYHRLGETAYHLLTLPENHEHRINFLLPMDRKLPYHLFCFPCCRYHLRTNPGYETIKPANVLNPFYNCPNGTNILMPPARLRISEGRSLPFSLVQLGAREFNYGPEHGIPIHTLARRWKDPYSDWTHLSQYHIHTNGHVLMRVKSQVYVYPGMTQAAVRLLLYSRGDYTPYFSVCAHWRDGILTTIPKCAMKHIPVREVNAITQFRTAKPVGIVPLCGECRPMRRCPECPTEYLFELKMVEDNTVERNSPGRFKQALIATRWSDLGPARSPADKEWAAIVGENEEYDSFTEIGKRAVSGVFESAFSDTGPGQRILSMNPKGVKRGEAGNDWY